MLSNMDRVVLRQSPAVCTMQSLGAHQHRLAMQIAIQISN
jgi:hypothetical protein